jgi:hypothetical protein
VWKDTGAKVAHLAPNTNSNILAKSISKDGGTRSVRATAGTAFTRKRKPLPGPAELGVWAVKGTHMVLLTAHTRRRRLMGRAAALGDCGSQGGGTRDAC